jgi:hypothetical protein
VQSIGAPAKTCDIPSWARSGVLAKNMNRKIPISRTCDVKKQSRAISRVGPVRSKRWMCLLGNGLVQHLALNLILLPKFGSFPQEKTWVRPVFISAWINGSRDMVKMGQSHGCKTDKGGGILHSVNQGRSMRHIHVGVYNVGVKGHGDGLSKGNVCIAR